ncbi:hypothetical protein, partial [Botrimarina sp.]|uniref:hypothetical protein n=1 Tax=Botrimarina sp. TaxID=2795802 RepID=UPI0032EC1CD5
MAYDSGRRPDRRGAAVRLARAERLESRVAPGVFLAWFAAWESLSGAPETAIAAPALQPTESTGRLRPLAASTGNTLGPPPDDWATLLAAERVAHGASPQPGVAPMASVASPAEQASVVDGALANWLAQPPTETPEEAASVLLGPALPAPAIPPATAGGASAAAGGAAPQSSGGGSAAPVTFAAGAASGGFVASAAAVGSPTTQAGTPRPEAAAGLSLIDASGAAVDTSDNANTVVVGAATWCPKCADFKAQLAEAPAAVEGLRVVFAFGDEGGAGPGGVRDAAFLDGLPGEVAFYAEGSVRADRYPTAFNPASGLFDTHAADAVDAWAAGAWGAQPALRLTDAAGQPLGVRPGPDTLVVGAATWCGYCAQLKQQLATPEMRQATEGLTVVFAFADEGGTGPGGVRDAAFLDSLPGEVAFLAPGGVRPSSFPSVYDPATGAFAGSAFTAIDAWIQAASAAAAEPVAAGATAASAATTCELPGDYNADGVVDGADYTVWRDTLGSTSDLRADGQPDG